MTRHGKYLPRGHLGGRVPNAAEIIIKFRIRGNGAEAIASTVVSVENLGAPQSVWVVILSRADRKPKNDSIGSVRRSILSLIAALSAVGCLYPPVTQPPPDAQQEVVIPLPYDLAWDAVNAVITENSFHVQAQDMTNGIIEAVGPRFTLHDADCGKVKSVA